MSNRPNILKFPTSLSVHLRFAKQAPGATPDATFGYGNAYSATSCATQTPAWMSAPAVVQDERPLSELPELAQVIICNHRFDAALAGDRHAVEAGHTVQVGESLLTVDAALLKAATESRPE